MVVLILEVVISEDDSTIRSETGHDDDGDDAGDDQRREDGVRDQHLVENGKHNCEFKFEAKPFSKELVFIEDKMV